MKNVFIGLIAMVLTFTAQAARVDSSTSWRTLSRTAAVTYQMPQIRMGNLFTRVSNVCVDGSQLRTLKKIAQCTQWGGRDNDICRSERSRYLYKDIEGTRKVCVRWEQRGRDQECAEYGMTSYKIPLSYDIPVYKTRYCRDNDFECSSRYAPMFVKEFNIPECSN